MATLMLAFLSVPQTIVVPFYKRNFEDCGAFANLFDLHRKGEKFSQGIELARASPSNSELLFKEKLQPSFMLLIFHRVLFLFVTSQ